MDSRESSDRRPLVSADAEMVQRFRAWAERACLDLRQSERGDYIRVDTSYAWEAWRAASFYSADTIAALRQHWTDYPPGDIAELKRHAQRCEKLVSEQRDTIAALRKDADIPEVAADVLAEVTRAIKKFPTWPTDPLHAVAVLGEEFGELTKAVLQSVYEPHKSTPADARAEAIQTAAMALRFLASLERYEYAKGAQHDQPGLDAAQSTEGER